MGEQATGEGSRMVRFVHLPFDRAGDQQGVPLFLSDAVLSMTRARGLGGSGGWIGCASARSITDQL